MSWRSGSNEMRALLAFDCMLIAQALALDVPLVTNETSFEQYGIRRLW
jgi:PIN domain nuclease of toxin-antitoxin system